MSKPLTFDEVFATWLFAETGAVEGRDLLPVAKVKGFSSVTEWRLATALRLGMDEQTWVLETIEDPAAVLPSVIIGPYKGWSKFFENRFTTSFRDAMSIPEFFAWCQTHDRIVSLSERFPLPTTVILFRLPSGALIHIEGGHRMCAVAYAEKVGKPIDFGSGQVSAAIADVPESGLGRLRDFLGKGTEKESSAGN